MSFLTYIWVELKSSYMRKIVLLITAVFLISLHAICQTQITGTVKDPSGNSVPYATVKVKGGKSAVIADANGVFKISAAANAQLVISAVGYSPLEVSAQDNMQVVLQASTQTLSDVVVTGTGVATSKKRLGISVESVTADKLPLIPAATVDQALVGKIPGA